MKNPGELALKLQKHRKEKGITYQQLAQKTELSIATIESIFQGKQKNPTLTTLQRVCDVLELSIDKLINREKFKFFSKGNKIIFSNKAAPNGVEVNAALLDKIEDKDELMTIAYLEVNDDIVYKFLIPYDNVKIMLTKGTASVNGKMLPKLRMIEANKEDIKKGLTIKAKKGSRAIFCFIPGVHIENL